MPAPSRRGPFSRRILWCQQQRKEETRATKKKRRIRKIWAKKFVPTFGTDFWPPSHYFCGFGGFLNLNKNGPFLKGAATYQYIYIYTHTEILYQNAQREGTKLPNTHIRLSCRCLVELGPRHLGLPVCEYAIKGWGRME